MNIRKHRSFHVYLTQIGKQAQLASSRVDTIIENYFDEIQADNYIDSAERVKVTRNNEGDVIVATSLKIPNLRFNLWKLLYSVTEKGIAIIDAKGEPFRTAFFIIAFLKDVFELSSTPITNQDATILVGIHVLNKTNSRRPVTVDQVNNYFFGKFTENQILDSLENLKTIACIFISDDGIIEITESLIIVSEE